VEDSATQAQLLAEMLARHGYEPVVAVNGRRAMEVMADKVPDLVISDVVMPEMDGYALCRAMKDTESLVHVPVILLTTLADPGDVLRGLECGADNFIRKPIAEQYLLARIEYLLTNRPQAANLDGILAAHGHPGRGSQPDTPHPVGHLAAPRRQHLPAVTNAPQEPTAVAAPVQERRGTCSSS
jgi:PleD family two-component response regulator